MKPIHIFIILVSAILIPLFIFGQEGSQFQEIEDLLISIRLNRGDILYSDSFNTYNQTFQRLQQDESGRAVTDAERNKLQQIEYKLREINQATEKVRPYFSSIFAARDKAISDGASDFAPQLFRRAESSLQKAAIQLRNEVSSNVDEKLTKILNLYRKAHFQAIQNKLLSEVRILIEESKDLDAEKYAPRTYLMVTELLSEVENILNRNQFNNPNLQDKAAQLSEESQHLLYITQLANDIESHDANFEDYILKLENLVAETAALFDYEPNFSQGIEPVLENIEISVQELQDQNQQLKVKNLQLRDSLKHLNEEIVTLEEKLGHQKTVVQKIERLKQEFSDSPVKITKRPGKVVYHLNGIQFQPGKYMIEERYPPILQRIGESLQKFPEQNITVRLGQVFSGNMDYSKTLADQRAKAVAFIIQSTAYISDQRIRFEGVMIEDKNDNGHAVVEILVDLK